MGRDRRQFLIVVVGTVQRLEFAAENWGRICTGLVAGWNGTKHVVGCFMVCGKSLDVSKMALGSVLVRASLRAWEVLVVRDGGQLSCLSYTICGLHTQALSSEMQLNAHTVSTVTSYTWLWNKVFVDSRGLSL